MPNRTISSVGGGNDGGGAGDDGNTGTWIPPELRKYIPNTPARPFDKAVSKHQRQQQEKPEWQCPKPGCRLTFRSEADLTKHQKLMSHWRCFECLTDFPDEEALSTHFQLTHRQTQDLKCPGCAETFTAASHLVGHIENNRCPRMFPSMLHERRQKLATFNHGLRQLNPMSRGFGLGEGMSHLNLNEKHPPQQMPDEATLASQESYTQQYPELGKELKDYRNGYSAVPDLLTGEPRTKLTIPPAVKIENRWEKGKDQKLFPQATPAVRPSPQELEDLTAATPSTQDIDPNERVINPDDDRFNPAVFYHEILRKFNCAYAPKCKAKFQTSGALIAHLRSQAHRSTVEFTCPRCLRKYKSMAAAMAHVENATRVCNIRETEDFRKFVSHITGGMLDGLNSSRDRLTDGTPRYIIPKAFYDSLPPSHKNVQ